MTGPATRCGARAWLAGGDLKVFEKLIRYASLAVGLKPSATGCEARLRGLEWIMYAKTMKPTVLCRSLLPCSPQVCYYISQDWYNLQDTRSPPGGEAGRVAGPPRTARSLPLSRAGKRGMRGGAASPRPSTAYPLSLSGASRKSCRSNRRGKSFLGGHSSPGPSRSRSYWMHRPGGAYDHARNDRL